MRKDILHNNKIALVGFWGPYDEGEYKGIKYPCLRTDKIFKEIAEGGFNVIFQGNYPYPDRKMENEECISYCDKYNMDFLVSLAGVPDLDAFHNQDVKENKGYSVEEIEKMIQPFIHKKGCGGVFAVDEPFEKAYPGLGQFVDAFKKAQKNLGEDKCCFINLLPKCGFTGMGEGQYEKYIANSVDVAKADFISIDFYPFAYGREMSCGLYNILGVVREKALERDVPYGGCVQMGGNWTEESDYVGLRRPTPAEITWEVNFMLAIGCTVITYFTLCNPHSYYKYLEHHGETGAFLPNGEKSDLYYGAQKGNAYANALSKYLLNAKSTKVIFNEGFPAGFEDRFEDFLLGGGYNELVKVDGDGTITGCFDYQGKTALYVVNHFKQDNDITLYFDKKYNLKVCDDIKEESVKNVDKLSFRLEKGQAKFIIVE